ncbi:ATP-binding protein [Mycoavidus sp. SF9855]|uniref:ATP-binding protein n=1 Tax=Mycoavidus sp. SF9855 TaxID=2968475 RepID=UPI00211C0ABE|nr:ATP-binding protein [Mycoavidus sp. SF9855]UUM22290.1 ATP-binding protein [Mycoavidus sp. SF9855]
MNTGYLSCGHCYWVWSVLFVWVYTISIHAHGAENKICFSSEERTWLNQHPVVRIAVAPGWGPIEFIEHGQHQGLTAGYLQAITQISGLQFQLVPTGSLQASLKELRAGHVDLLPIAYGFPEVDEALGYVLCTRPYFSGSSVFITKGEVPVTADLQQLAGHVVAISNSTFYTHWLGRYHPDIKILKVTSSEAALAAVATGKAYAALGFSMNFHHLINTKYRGVLFYSSKVPNLPIIGRMGVRGDLALLRDILDKSLAMLSAAQKDEIEQRWIYLSPQPSGAQSASQTVAHHTSFYRSYHEALVLAISSIIFICLVLHVWQTHKKASETVKEKSLLLAVFSHELRTPISAIISAVEMLKRFSGDARRQSRLIAVTESTAQSLLLLLNDTLNNEGELPLKKTPVQLATLAKEAIDVVAAPAANKRLPIFIDMSKNLPERVYVDALRLKQICVNLLANAVKFTDTGSVTLKLAIDKSNFIENTAELIIEVRDTGIGICPQQQTRLFRPFSQANHSITRRYGGSGLGLMISNKLVKRMGGSITIESVRGQGTTARVWVPIQVLQWNSNHPQQQAKQQVDQRPSLSVVAQASAPTSTAPTVLLIEDHIAIQSIVLEQISALGYRAVLAANGTQGLKMWQEHSFPLVLMDCSLPDLDGYTVAREIRRMEQQRGPNYPRTALLALSAATDNTHQTQCFASGMDGVLSKPLDSAALQRMLAVWAPLHGPESSVDSTSDKPTVLSEINPLNETARTSIEDPSRLIIRFQQSIAQDMSQLDAALQRCDIASVAHYAHQIKGSALMCKFSAIAHTADQLERVARSRSADREQLDQALRDLRKACSGQERPLV